MMPRFPIAFALAGLLVATGAQAQTPQPFPRPGTRTETPPAAPPAPILPAEEAPTEATLGLPVFPNAQFIASYDAGKGQRFYLFGTVASYGEVVSWYRTTLDERGNVVFDEPPVHTFEVGRFRENTMAFPPGVTVKDYTWGGSEGYLNPRGGNPARFPTIIQIVPQPVDSRQ